MKIYTCEKCLKDEQCCEVTVQDDKISPIHCPYGFPEPLWTLSYPKEEKP